MKLREHLRTKHRIVFVEFALRNITRQKGTENKENIADLIFERLELEASQRALENILSVCAGALGTIQKKYFSGSYRSSEVVRRDVDMNN